MKSPARGHAGSNRHKARGRILAGALRQRRLPRLPVHALPLALCLLGLGIAALIVPTRESGAERTAEAFVAAWERSDYPAMHALLTPQSRRRSSPTALARAYEGARETATATALRAGEPEGRGDEVEVPIAVDTRIFGRLRGHVVLPVGRLRGHLVLPVADKGVVWAPHLVFPGLREGERLQRRAEAPPRAAILDRNGEPIVSGPVSGRRVRGLGARSLAGAVRRPETPEQREENHLRGLPPESPVGVSGLESMLEREVAGAPGGRLLAGNRTIAASRPRPARAVRSTLDLRLQAVADRALGGRTGGIAALDAQTAEVRALSGLAFSAPQPPGSTFKIITATSALEGGVVDVATPFPVERGTSVGGGWIENADGEACGGRFIETFAHSCNSVFAPLGVRVGAERLVRAAERYGFNQRPTIRGAKASTLPKGRELGSDRELAATAIGQGRILTTPLQLASVTQAVAMGGRRGEPTVAAEGRRAPPRQITTPAVARTLAEMMIAVVERGTGQRARMEGIRVAGKTGTAELGSGAEASETDTDAWFTAYAPADRPKVVLAVMLIRQGQGGETAAPVAREVLEAGAR